MFDCADRWLWNDKSPQHSCKSNSDTNTNSYTDTNSYS
jgi:hypothetical protein